MQQHRCRARGGLCRSASEGDELFATGRNKLATGIAAAVLFAAGVAQAAAPVLRVERVDASAYPMIRAYVTLVGSSGTPITGLSKENFKVVELKKNEVSPAVVHDLDASGYGASVAVVMQASGTMSPVMDEMKKAVSGYFSSLGDADQVAFVIYSNTVEVLAPMGDKSAAASAASKVDNPGYQRLMYDGVATALGLFMGDKLPKARAIIVVGDGGDSGSSADLSRLVSESKKKNIPLFAIGHSEVGGVDLDQLKALVVGSLGGDFGYADAPGPEDFNKGFVRIKDLIGKQYVVEWKAKSIKADKKTYPLEISVEIGDTKLRASGEVETPFIKNYTTLIVLLVSVLLLAGIGVLVYIKTRPQPVPVVLCPVCRQEQMQDWDVCLFCMRVAKATLKGTKGPAAGKTFPLVGKNVKIGKGPENMIKIPDPTVSTNHCGIQINGTHFEVVDLGSSNGTFVNGKKVDRRALRNGDILTFGQTEMLFASTATEAEGGDYGEGY